MSVTSAARSRQHFVCRNYMALVFAPELPIEDWLAKIGDKVRDAGNFIAGWPAVLDLSGAALENSDIARVVSELGARGIRIMGIENAHASQAGENVPPVVRASRGGATELNESSLAARNKRTEGPTLLIDQPIRSGQNVTFLEGDVTVLGAVGSGAEVVAGGSIHIYGALRGRALAGANGNLGARIYCTKIEAELLAISGYYLTTDSMDQSRRGRPSQVWLEGDVLKIAALD